jgi:DNA-binding NarL/FixJ family response regulator
VEKVRVLVANRPRLMRELVKAAISEQPDIEIVGEIQDEPEILGAIEKTRPDFLIIAQEEPGRRPAICDSVLEKYPLLKILAVAPGRNSSVCYWTGPGIGSRRVETSEEGVLNALRGKA